MIINKNYFIKTFLKNGKNKTEFKFVVKIHNNKTYTSLN